ncbi:MAG: serine/threonine protein kinase [Pseudonocardiales bacterium]|nr:serine/threonine protein kinase [Pseudonocardiales bacterium]
MLDRIGIGGMGVVWRAIDERLERLVAVKQLLLQPELSPRATDEARARALREARIAARLQHPNAIVVYDVAEHEGEPCLVMEYLPARSLAAVLGERGCLPVPDVASIGRQIASALAAAHTAQIVHRDVKPGNILITDDGTAKITDFGVSRAVGDVTVTQTGMMAGTPAYLAPEVARGQIPTPASDVFSLGATLYAAVEGRGPFGENDNPLALLHAVAGGQVAPPQHAGPLSAVLMRLLATDPAARPDMHRASLELAAVRTTQPLPRPAPASRPAAVCRSTTALPPNQVTGTPKTGTSTTGSAGTGRLEIGSLETGLAGPPTVAAAPLSDSAQEVVPTPPAWPADSFPTHPKQRRRRAGVLAGAVLAVLAFAGGGVLLSEGSSRQQGAHSVGQATTSVPAAKPEPAPAPAPAVIPPPPQVERVDHSQPIGWSDAGQLVIDYYNGLNNLSSAWQLLSPTAQAVFGNESDFRAHWSQYSSVSARNAFGVTDNPDGSVKVPVEVTYNTGGSAQVVKRVLRVTRLDGHLLIDSDPR